nr:MAG TPA: hypothetical protein [Caudoviricetes sp.]
MQLQSIQFSMALTSVTSKLYEGCVAAKVTKSWY